jgi:hypothetical protein
METFLCCFVHACPKQWFKWLHLAEFWYNTSWHSALSKSPFEVLYGHAPRIFGISPSGAQPVTNLNSWLQERELMQVVIKQHLSRAQGRMKRQADKNRSERVFVVGDQVFLKLRPYVQPSLAPRANQKLAFKFFGPFKIIAKIGAVAYKLQLPPSAAIHPVFHVSQLKRAVPATHQVTPQVPGSSDSYQVPVAVLRRRLSSGGGTPHTEVLIQWSGWPASLATWERRFPRAPAWGPAGSFGGGSVSTADGTATTPSEDAAPDGPRRGLRTRRPSSRVTGDEWAV